MADNSGLLGAYLASFGQAMPQGNGGLMGAGPSYTPRAAPRYADSPAAQFQGGAAPAGYGQPTGIPNQKPTVPGIPPAGWGNTRPLPAPTSGNQTTDPWGNPINLLPSTPNPAGDGSRLSYWSQTAFKPGDAVKTPAGNLIYQDPYGGGWWVDQSGAMVPGPNSIDYAYWWGGGKA